MKTTYTSLKQTEEKVMYILHDPGARWHQIVLLMIFIKNLLLASTRILKRCWSVVQDEIKKGK